MAMSDKSPFGGANSDSVLREPSTYAGIGLIFNGISDCMSGNYGQGAANIVLGLLAVFKREGGVQ